MSEQATTAGEEPAPAPPHSPGTTTTDATRAPSGKGTRIGAIILLVADRGQPGALFHRGPRDAQHHAGADPGLHGARRRGNRRQGERGEGSQQRRGGSGCRLVRHRPGPYRDRPSEKQIGLRNGPPHRQRVGGGGPVGRGGAAGGRSQQQTGRCRRHQAGAAVSGGPGGDLGAPPRDGAGDARRGGQPGEKSRGRPAQGEGVRRRRRRSQRATVKRQGRHRGCRARSREHHGGRSGARKGHGPAGGGRAFRPARRAARHADRRQQFLDQRRHDREQPRPHRHRRRGRDRLGHPARTRAERPRAQHRQRREFRPGGETGNAAADR